MCLLHWFIDFMFSVRFCHRVCRLRLRHRHCHRKDFCFSRKNHLSEIWDKESIGLGKCTRWPFHDLDTWFDFGEILLKTFLLANFLLKFWMCFFQGLLDISQEWLVRLMWKKEVHQFGYWVNYVTMTFDLTHDLELGLFKVKFQNSSISGIVIWLIWN